MSTNTAIRLTCTAVAAALAITIGTHAAPAMATIQTGRTATAHYQGWGDPVADKLAANAAHILGDHLRTALSMLDAGYLDSARGELINSYEFAAALGRLMPYTDVADRIMDARRALMDSALDDYYADLLTVRKTLDQMDDYAPKAARAARAAIEQAEWDASVGQVQRADEALKTEAEELTRTTVYLPVTVLENEIRAAQLAMQGSQPDVPAARFALQKALHALGVAPTVPFSTGAG